MNSRTMWLFGAGLLCLAGAVLAVATQGFAEANPAGANPNPVRLMRPPAAPLSAMAQLGREIFYDASLSSSGALSCASCHSPDHAYGPPNDGPVMLGGATLSRPGARAVPSLTYLDRHPNFSIGPDRGDDDNVIDLAQMAALGQQAARTTKTAGGSGASANIVPQGGLFWDGRADTLQDQALFPLLDPNEMDGGSAEIVAGKLRRASYASRFVELFSARVLDNQRLLIAEAMFAVARYQVEEPSFHPYTSKYDYWLEGKARLSEGELRGLQAFNDPDKANCAGCHTSAPTRDGLPPLFTDHQYEALGAPRNAALAKNRDPNYFDLGVCGPHRTDMPEQTQYCGMFLTPTLRNTAVRHAFFHNGVFRNLEQVLDFYNFRDTNPEKVFPRAADGTVLKYDDLPQKYHANVDVIDPPFDRHPGDRPAMTEQDKADIIAFLKTLTDGYKPEN
ncbi:cytochrome c peroxidase [Bradyrhizobium diazoefficiens]|uniref:Putative methylamine utilization protein n=1 Tax=Bradyrhizobium diazoefficiens TaxID=1355477 RepID=A0A0E4BLV6_9BRAD|nr:cytochrome c peroxidase [Bradyrhizobium diazoefficiens]MBR0863854.1 cytochrome-c peroxidase [Bradyrhizobium diazoefficiens]MBR0888485.1 cytochrome-c peroxidase [Bradyrhizobium diazoefficiens]MBR0920305.1 cytochrome-c peroxidase [Bradyrhizobium diazoefficiens]WLA67343.1 cytochrome c peroxidase [Bradyrhizobium diazoefficiens]BAR54782.1 putative methylamine utilization protein [Bradyrhizobium diazoefficiens]